MLVRIKVSIAAALIGICGFIASCGQSAKPVDASAQPANPSAPPVDLVTPLIPAGAPGKQKASTVVFDGSNYLVIWQDERKEFKNRPQIRAMRVSADGVPIDKTPHIIGDTWTNTYSWPQAIRCGGKTVVTWHDNYAIKLSVLSFAGKTLSQESITHKVTRGTMPMTQLACAGNSALVVWVGQSNPSNRYGAPTQIFGASVQLGKALFMDTLTISAAEDSAHNPEVSSDGVDFFVTWVGRRGRNAGPIIGVPVSGAGVVDYSNKVELGYTQLAPRSHSLANTGRGRYLAAWVAADDSTQPQGNAGPPATGVMVSTVLASAGTVSKQRSITRGLVKTLRVAARDSQVVLAWSDSHAARSGDSGAVWSVRLDQDGTPRGKPRRESAIGRYVSEPAIALGSHNALLTWTDHGTVKTKRLGQYSRTDIWTHALAAPSATTTPRLLTRGQGDQSQPAVASAGTEFLWTWIDEANDPKLVRATRVDGAGKVLDGAGFVVHQGTDSVRFPKVASDGKDYLVTWNSHGIYAVRVSRQGKILDASPIQVASSAGQYAVAFDGKNYVFLWGSNKAVTSRQLSPAGTLLAPAHVMKVSFGSGNVGLACAPGSCLAVWRYSNNAYRYSSIVGTRLIDGAPEVAARYGRTYSWITGHRSHAAVIWNGTEYEVTWKEGKLRFGVRADHHGLVQTAPRPTENLALGNQQAMNERGQILTVSELEDAKLGMKRVVGRLEQHAVPTKKPVPTGPPVKLSTLFARVRAIAASKAWRDSGFHDKVLELNFDRLIAAVDRATSRGRAPVLFADVIPGRKKSVARKNIQLGNKSVSIALNKSRTGAFQKELVVNRGGDFHSANDAIILADGNINIGYVKDSIIIATGAVHLAHVDRVVVVAGGKIEISHDGSAFSSGQGFGSVLLSSTTVSASHTRGAVIGSPDGILVRATNGGVFLNSGKGSIQSGEIVLNENSPSSLEGQVEAVVGKGKKPRVALFKKGGTVPIAFGRWGFELETSSSSLRAALVGYSVRSSAPGAVVLGKGTARIRLSPIKRMVAFPAGPTIPMSTDTKIHGVGIYEPIDAAGRVPVDLDLVGPTVLVLTAYRSARWQLKLEGRGTLSGVVLLGMEPQVVEGLPRGVPVVSRIKESGEDGYFGYINEGGEKSRGFDRIEKTLRGIGVGAFHSFRGGYRGRDFVVHGDDRGLVHVPEN